MASRYIEGGSPGQWSLSRKIVSRVAALLALPLTPKVKDRMSGFFGFKRSVIDTKTLSPTGWKIGLEILVRSKSKSVTEVPYTFMPRAHGESKLSRRIMTEYLKQLFYLYSFKYPILDFMVVGGIGTVINLGVYSLLVLLPALKTFQYNVVGKTYYFPPFILSSLVAIVSNYLMNKAWTFRGWKEQKGGFARYLTMGVIALIPDSGLLIIFVEFGKLPYVLAAALAIVINFIFRFLIARSWVWKKKAPQKN
jgi:dolichol-phosphate mannosyltransferase